jgi:hypothetical protein
MRAYGSDRIRVTDDGTIELSSRVPKNGWEPRVAKTLIRMQRPGTAVLWDEECYEVVDAVMMAQGMRYLLAPWRDEETMRLTSRYDEEAESARAAERRDAIRREKYRRTANFLGIFTGHLPGSVQQRLAHEYNIDAPRLTMLSTLPQWIAVTAIVLVAVDRTLGQQGPLPLPWFLLAGYVALDSTIRFKLAFVDGRATGSIFGLIAYAIYYGLAPNRKALVNPMEERRGESTPIREYSAEEQQQHALHVREPLLTLLSVADQRRIAQRFDYDHRRTATNVAIGILIVAIIGIVTSINTIAATPRISAWVSLVSAGALAIEQIVRIPRLGTRPVGSFLAPVARLFARRFL